MQLLVLLALSFISPSSKDALRSSSSRLKQRLDRAEAARRRKRLTCRFSTRRSPFIEDEDAKQTDQDDDEQQLDDLDLLRKHMVIDFDTKKYPLREALIAVLEEFLEEEAAKNKCTPDAQPDGGGAAAASAASAETAIFPASSPSSFLPTQTLHELHKFPGHPSRVSEFNIDQSGNAIALLQSLWNFNRARQAAAATGRTRRGGGGGGGGGKKKKTDDNNNSPPPTASSSAAVAHQDTPAYRAFEQIYQALIRDVIGPTMVWEQSDDGDDDDDDVDEAKKKDSVIAGADRTKDGVVVGQNGKALVPLGPRTILYQRAPTFRCYLGNAASPMGALHCDEDYLHQPSELNFWLPISDFVGGTNSLWVESKPNKGDFKSVTLSYGQIVRGYMNKCRHFNKKNESGLTRMSIDFRALSDRTGGHDASFREGERRGAKAFWSDRYDYPGFYEKMEIP